MNKIKLIIAVLFLTTFIGCQDDFLDTEEREFLLSEDGLSNDEDGYKAEFIRLVEIVK